MKRALFVVIILALYGCVAHIAQPVAPKPVVILGNKTTPAVCDDLDAHAANVRAAKWKAYAEQLETRLGIPHEERQP